MPLPSNSASVPGVRVVYRHDGAEREDAGTPGAQPSRRGAFVSGEGMALVFRVDAMGHRCS